MVRFKFWLALVFLVLLLVLALQNSDVVSMEFFFWEKSVSLLLLIPILAGTGFLIGLLCGMGLGKPRG